MCKDLIPGVLLIESGDLYFSFIVFDGLEVLFVYDLLFRPQRTAYSEVTIPDGNPSKDWQSTVGWGVCWIRTQDCRFTVWHRYQ
jgi:hypothetical protein